VCPLMRGSIQAVLSAAGRHEGGHAASEEHECYDATRPEVRRWGITLARSPPDRRESHLRCHVSTRAIWRVIANRCTHPLGRFRAEQCHAFGCPKVGQLKSRVAARCVEQQVLGLYVTMDDAQSMAVALCTLQHLAQSSFFFWGAQLCSQGTSPFLGGGHQDDF